jgi:quercetin dioxygenase-like cupin family protein
MPVIKYRDMKLNPVTMPGVKDAVKANVVGPDQGWENHTLRVFRLGAGGFTPRHQHDWEHINHVVKGKGRLRIGDQVYELEEKDFAFVPANTEHQFENPYDGEFEFICIVPNKGAY